MLIKAFYNAMLTVPQLIRFAGLFCLVMSCLPDALEVDSVPRAKEEIVVSTQMMSDESVLVLLTRTFGALDASDDSDPQALLDFIAVNDAMVTIEGPAGKDTLRFLGSGAYGGVFIPFETDNTYRLHVNSNSMGQVHASTEAKRQIDFESVDAELYYNGYNDTLAQITYALHDPPEQNWYMVNVQEVEREDFFENLLNPRAFTILLPDEEFNGRAYGETFRVFPRDYHPGDSIAVSLSNISKEYYDFMKLRIDNRFSFVEFISEPVDYPSNVVGGKGYFNLYLPDIRFIVFD
jgi:hypothetical protein